MSATTLHVPAPDTGQVTLLVATRKGTFILTSDTARRTWTTQGPMFFGHTVHHMVLDPHGPPGGSRCASKGKRSQSGTPTDRWRLV